jgi:carbonic anhydrase
VTATLADLQGTAPKQLHLASIIDRVRPALQPLMTPELRRDPQALLHAAVRANIRASADHLRHGSEIVEGLIQQDGLLVIGAEYSLATGVVDFFDGA